MKFRLATKTKKGFSMVELIVVLSLLGIVLAGLYTFFSYTQKVYSMTEAQSRVQDDVNNALRMIANDIRSAAKPDEATKAVVIYTSGNEAALSGSRMDIFDYKDGKYYKTSYKYDSNQLLRGSVQKSTVTGADGIIDAVIIYTDILKGVQYPLDKELFNDRTDDSDGKESDRRTIEINLLVKDEEGSILQELSMPSTYTSRTKGVP